MQQMGFSAQEADASMSKLSDGIDGLPTTLDGVASSTKQLAITTGDLEGSTDLALALNDAFLASGSSAEDASRGMTQYTQMLSSGKVDMQSWKTLQETMPYALREMATELIGTGASTQDLYKAMQSGEVTFDMFNDKLVELDTSTGGFAETARVSTGGIGTAWKNMQTAITRGTANIITSIDTNLAAASLPNLEESIKMVGAAFKSFLDKIAVVAGYIIKTAAPAIKLIGNNLDIVIPIAGAFIALWATTKLATFITDAGGVVNVLKNVASALNAATIAKIKDGAETLYLNALYAKDAIQKGISTVATIANTAATKLAGTAHAVAAGQVSLFSLALNAIPFVAIIAGAVALVAGIAKIISSVSSVSKETKEYTKSINENIEARKEDISTSSAEAEASAVLANKLIDLSNKTDKTATDISTMKVYADSLNDSLGEGTVVIDEYTGAMNITEDALYNLIDAMKAEAEAAVYQEKLTEAARDRVDATEKLTEAEEKLEAIEKQMTDTSIGNADTMSYLSVEYNKAQAEVDALKGTVSEIDSEMDGYSESIVDATNKTSDLGNATAEATGKAATSIAELSESQQSAIENMKTAYTSLKDQTTNVFDAIEVETGSTIEQMKNNLQSNIDTVKNWSENMAELTRRGVNEGLLQTLQDAGPEAAASVQNLVNASDAELGELNALFEQGGSAAVDALANTFGIDTSVAQSTANLANGAALSLREQVSAAGFDVIGGDAVSGYVQGITDKAAEADTALTQMAIDGQEALQTANDSHSPSKKFQGFGKDAIDGYILGIKEGAINVATAMTEIIETTTTLFGSKGAEVAQKMVEGIKMGLTSIPSEVNNALAPAAEMVSAWGSALKLVVQSSFQSIPAIIGAQLSPATAIIASWTASTQSTMSNGLNAIRNVVVNSFVGINATISSGISLSSSTMSTGMANMVNSAITQFAQLNNTARNAMTTFKNTVINMATSTFSALVSAASTGMNSFKSQITSGMTAAVKSFTTGLSSMTTAVSSWGGSLASAGSSAISQLNSAITSGMSGIPGAMYNIGVNAANSFTSGMAGQRGNVYSYVYNYYKGIADQAKSALGIASPSKVFKAFGKFTVEGFLLGLDGMATQLENTMDNLFSPDLSDLKLTTSVEAIGTSQLNMDYGNNTSNGKTGDIKITQNIQTVSDTPYELAQQTIAGLRRARWT